LQFCKWFFFFAKKNRSHPTAVFVLLFHDDSFPAVNAVEAFLLCLKQFVQAVMSAAAGTAQVTLIHPKEGSQSQHSGNQQQRIEQRCTQAKTEEYQTGKRQQNIFEANNFHRRSPFMIVIV